MEDDELEQLAKSTIADIKKLNEGAVSEGQATDERFAHALADPDVQEELARQRHFARQIVDELDRRRKARKQIEFVRAAEPPRTEESVGSPGSAAPAVLPEGSASEPETPGPWPTIDAGSGDARSYDDGRRFGWKKVVVAGIVAAIAAAVGLTFIFSGSSKNDPTKAPSPGAGAAPVTITDNQDKFIGGDPCSNGILHLQWDISGGHRGEVVVIKESGPGLPPRRTFKLDADGSFDVDVHTGGNGVYATQIVSIGGQPPPAANSTNSATVKGCT